MRKNFEYNEIIRQKFEEVKLDHRTSLQKEALQFIAENGLPGPKHEDWKYTNPNNILKEDFFRNNTNIATDKEDVIAKAKKYLKGYSQDIILFIDGNLASSKEEIAFLIKEKEPTISNQADWNAMFALNSIFSPDNIEIVIPKNEEHSIEIVHVITGNIPFANPSLTFHVNKGGRLSILEQIIDLSNTGSESLYNNSTKVELSEGAYAEIHKIQEHLKPHSLLTDNIFANQQRDSIFKTTLIQLSVGVSKHIVQANLLDTNAFAEIKGLYMLDGKEHVDNQIVVNHQAPHCESNQLFKGVLDGESTGIFNGIIKVQQDAQKTNAYQNNNHLLLSKSANGYSKPQLEIYADDVKCSHGSTSTQPDKEALFYLHSRGISPKAALDLMAFAFCNEVAESIDNEKIREIAVNAVANKSKLSWL